MNEEMLTDTKIWLWVLQSTQQLDMLGLEQESLFSSWDTYGFCCDLFSFFKFLLSQSPCEDLCQSQVPEDFPGTEVTIWICSSHISFLLSHEHFGVYFTLP